MRVRQDDECFSEEGELQKVQALLLDFFPPAMHLSQELPDCDTQKMVEKQNERRRVSMKKLCTKVDLLVYTLSSTVTPSTLHSLLTSSSKAECESQKLLGTLRLFLTQLRRFLMGLSESCPGLSLHGLSRGSVARWFAAPIQFQIVRL